MTTLSLKEAADLMHTTPETVSDAIHNRGLPAARIGRAYVLVQSDVIEWLRAQYGAWKEQGQCDSTAAAKPALGGLTSARREASALDAALAPQTSRRPRNTPPRLRKISGAKSDLEKLPA